MKAMQPKKLQAIRNLPDRTLWQEIDDRAAAKLSGGGLFKGWGKCQVPGKCEVGISIVVKFQQAYSVKIAAICRAGIANSRPNVGGEYQCAKNEQIAISNLEIR